MTTAGTVYEVLTNATPKHGRLRYVSATALSFKPFGGDAIKLNGRIRTIPAAGIVGLANTGVFVNGVAGQNLVAYTLYTVYVFDNSGVLTADFRTTPIRHIPSPTAGNVGVEVYSPDGTTPDDTRSLIGMICTTPSTAQFVDSYSQRFVISWFNRRNLPLCGPYTPGVVTSATSMIELSAASRIEFLTWVDEHVQLIICGQAQGSGANYARSSFGYDGTTMITALEALFLDRFASINYTSSGQIIAAECTEGYHYVTPIGYVSGTSGTFYMFVSGIVRG
jgi:hypothetical protein